MTKITEANSQQQVYDCYLKGMTIEETVSFLHLPYKYIKSKYQDFIVYSAKLMANRNSDRIFQIRMIENELFEAIEANIRKPNAERTAFISELQGVYSRFNATN